MRFFQLPSASNSFNVWQQAADITLQQQQKVLVVQQFCSSSLLQQKKKINSNKQQLVAIIRSFLAQRSAA
jgi:hypothetical protein